MTTEAVDEIQENSGLTPEQEAAADAEFEAAFNQARGDESHVEGTTSQNDAKTGATEPDAIVSDEDKAAIEAAEAEAAAQRAAAEKEAAENAPVTLTAKQFAELQARLSKVDVLEQQLTTTHDKTFGRLGQLQQTINELKQRAGSGNKLSIKQLKRLEAEFPEMANLLKEDLSEAFGGTTEAAPENTSDNTDQQQGQSQADQTQTQVDADPFANPEVQKTLRAKEMAIVTAIHPTWKQDKETPEFKEWISTLPEVAVTLLGSTWDSEVMVPAFNDFKKWKADRQAKLTAKQENDKRLANAITATDGSKATGAHVLDEDAAFEEGFKKARSGR